MKRLSVIPVLLVPLVVTACVSTVDNQIGKIFRDCTNCPEMVVIPAGSYLMGDLSGDGGADEKPVRLVMITKPFAVGKYEITQEEWQAVMENNPSNFKGDRRPVEQISWHDAKNFVMKLNARTGKKYRLLSESEWEYAARAGSVTKYHYGNNISGDYANFAHKVNKTTPVGRYSPNSFGLYDMHGNVSEWVEDCWNDSYSTAGGDSVARTSGNCEKHVLRGGSWTIKPWFLRSAYRSWSSSNHKRLDFGFRVARTL